MIFYKVIFIYMFYFNLLFSVIVFKLLNLCI